MTKTNNKQSKWLVPGNMFLLFSIIVTIFSTLFKGKLVDLHIYDTMFVISPQVATVFLVSFALVFFVIYRAVTLPWKQAFSWMHAVLTLIPLASLFCSFYIVYPDGGMPERYLDSSSAKNISVYEMILSGMVICFLLGQLLFALNFVVGLIRGKVSLNNAQ